MPSKTTNPSSQDQIWKTYRTEMHIWLSSRYSWKGSRRLASISRTLLKSLMRLAPKLASMKRK